MSSRVCPLLHHPLLTSAHEVHQLRHVVSFQIIRRRRRRSRRWRWRTMSSASLRQNECMTPIRPPHMTSQHTHTNMPTRHFGASSLGFSMISWTETWRPFALCSVRGRTRNFVSGRDSLSDIYHAGAINDLNPSLRLGEDAIDAVLLTLESIRQRALSKHAR